MTPYDFLYHVTLASNLMSIQEDDLAPGAGQSFGGGYEAHARGRLFMCDYDSVLCWWNKIDDLVQHNFEGEEIIEDHRIPVVLRFPAKLVEDDLKEDALGSRDCIGGESYFITGEPIGSMDIDVWDGTSWVSLVDLDAPDDVTSAYIERAERVEEEDDDGEQTGWWDVELRLPEFASHSGYLAPNATNTELVDDGQFLPFKIFKTEIGEESADATVVWHLYKKRPEAYVETFIVPPGNRRRGAGRSAYALWEAALPPEVQYVRLTQHAGSAPFWKKMGFEWHYDMPDEKRRNDPSPEAAEMVKGLHGPAPLLDYQTGAPLLRNAAHTRLEVFDFDNTLFRSPEKPSTWPAGKGWWGRSESLSAPCVPVRPDDSWWNKEVVNEARRAIADPDTLAVLMTGRLQSRFSERVADLLLQKGLDFDEVYLTPGSGTLPYKLKELLRILEERPEIQNVTIWDDREEHMPEFAGVLNEVGVSYELKLVHGAVMECDDLAPNRLLPNQSGWYIRKGEGSAKTFYGPYATEDEAQRAWMFSLSVDEFYRRREQATSRLWYKRLHDDLFRLDANEVEAIQSDPKGYDYSKVTFRKPVIVHRSWDEVTRPGAPRSAFGSFLEGLSMTEVWRYLRYNVFPEYRAPGSPRRKEEGFGPPDDLSPNTYDREGFREYITGLKKKRDDFASRVRDEVERTGAFHAPLREDVSLRRTGSYRGYVTLTRSTRPGIAWQVTFWEGDPHGADGVPTGHLDVSGTLEDAAREMAGVVAVAEGT